MAAAPPTPPPPGRVCAVRPEQTEGPYFVDRTLRRSDVRSDPTDGTVRPGAELHLTINVSSLAGAACAPLAGAVVDIWQCDALGVYSGFESGAGKKYLRGHQLTDPTGAVKFVTIYPGPYEGRAVHIHFKVRTDPGAARGGLETVSQLYFPEDLSDLVYASPAYGDNARTAGRRRNGDDRIFRGGGGEQLLLAVRRDGNVYAASFDLALRTA